MPISTVKLYFIENHQLANRQYYIGTKPTPIETFSNIKVTDNIAQSIQLPWNDDFKYCNLVEIEGKFYDVIGIDNITFKDKSVILNLILNPVVSYLSPNMSVSGYWTRTPSMQMPGVKVSIGNDILKQSRTIALPCLKSSTPRAFYYQITSKYDVDTSSVTGINLYGGLVPWMSSYLPTATLNNYKVSPSASRYFAPLNYMLSDIAKYTGLPTDSIIDVSISTRCPWKTTYSSANNSFGIQKLDGTYITGYQIPSTLINIVKLIGSDAYISSDVNNALTLTLSDYERYCGRVYIVDEMGNEIAEIPTEIFNSSNSLTYYCYASSDFTGIYTHFKYNDKIIVWPEGHLPWVGNSWSEYQVSALAYDRAELARSIEAVRKQQEIDTVAALSNAMLTSAVGVSMGNTAGAMLGAAQMGLGVITSEMMAKLSESQLYAKQRNKENYIKTQPSANYQVGYGLDYCNRSEIRGGAVIRIDTPANMTSTDFNNYIAYNGYPCNKYATFNLTSGYIEGILYTVPKSGANPLGNGPQLDALRKEIAAGCRILTS